MPLIIKANGPTTGTLAMPATWASRLSVVPDLVGAWDSRTQALGSIQTWAAEHGPGALSQSVEVNRPTISMVEGQRVAQWGAGKLLTIPGFTSGQPLTVAIRVFMSDTAVDNQAIFGGASSWRARYRNNTGGSVDMETSGATQRRPLTSNGWYNIMVVQGASSYTLDVNNGLPVTGTSSGAAMTTLAIGGLAANDFAANWRGNISRIAIARSALSGDALLAFRDWVNS